jgi:hypothetical protein
VRGLFCGDLFHRNRIIAMHLGIGAQALQVLHEIPREAVVVVEYKNHSAVTEMSQGVGKMESHSQG